MASLISKAKQKILKYRRNSKETLKERFLGDVQAGRAFEAMSRGDKFEITFPSSGRETPDVWRRKINKRTREKAGRKGAYTTGIGEDIKYSKAGKIGE